MIVMYIAMDANIARSFCVNQSILGWTRVITAKTLFQAKKEH